MNSPANRRPLRFAGYASVFDRLDQGGDIVRRGAFAKSLASRKAVPLLWQHQSGSVIGWIERLAEDVRGLQIIARLDDSMLGKSLRREVEARRLTGLSFGYRVSRSSLGPAGRNLEDLELVEVSLVRQPMQPLARIHKLAGEVRPGEVKIGASDGI